MRVRERAPRTSALTLVLLAGGLFFVPPRPLSAQADSARVSFRTTDLVFFGAGRPDGVRVGDTVAVVGDSGVTVARALVLSVSLRSASARLLVADAPVAIGQYVRFERRPPPVAIAPPPPPSDSAAAPAAGVEHGADTAAAAAAPAPWPVRSARRTDSRWRGGVQLEQLASSTGGLSALTTYQTVTSLSLTAPLAPGLEIRTRASSRWRSGASGRTTGLDGLSTIVYGLEARLAPVGAAWSVSFGRFVPTEAMGLGYIDGARLEVRVAPEQRVGVVAGFVPKVQRLGVSTAARRTGAYWSFGGSGALSGSLAAAADWQDGARRRTLLATQGYWRAAPAVSLATYAEVDAGAPWQTFSGLRLTTGYATMRADLPFGVRASLGLETHQAITLWERIAAGDTAGASSRLNGVNASLGRDLLGLRVEVSGGVLKRSSDATPTLRGALTVARGALFVAASRQHGDLFDYSSIVARLMVPRGAVPVTASLGASASFTRSAGGAVSQWRYSLQPEISRSLGGGLFASLGGDIGAYGGRASSFLHAGVSYRFR